MPYESIEASYIGQQLRENIARMVNNIRDNAEGYKAAISAGKAPGNVATIMREDADQFVQRLGWVRDMAQRNPAKFTQAIAYNQWTLSDFNALRNMLLNTCEHTKAAILIIEADIITEADFILATIPQFERTF